MSNASKRLLNIIKSTSENVNTPPSQIVTLKIKSISPLIFLYNEKLVITEDFYILDINFSTENLNIGDSVRALLNNNNQTYYILANKTISGQGGTSDYDDLTDKPKINGITLQGNQTTADLGITIPTKTSDLINDSNFITQEVDPTVSKMTNSDIIAVFTF